MTTSMDLQSAEKAELQNQEIAENTRPSKVFVPKADIFETEQDIVVMADLPGADENSVDITVEKNILSIHASVSPCEPCGHALTYAEYAVGDYQRRFTLPNEIDREGIGATMRNGVLKLVLPKSAAAKVKKITVKSE